MAHPRMYQDDDPFLTELRQVALAFPEAQEKESWGRPTFVAGKISVGMSDSLSNLLFAILLIVVAVRMIWQLWAERRARSLGSGEPAAEGVASHGR